MIEKTGKISIRRQCELLEINHSSLFYKKKMPSRDIEISRKINEIHERIPFYGYRKVTHELRRQGILVNLKKIQRVMHKNMVFALRLKKKRKTLISPSYKADFLLKDVKIQRPNQVWPTDISYIKMPCGYIHLSSIVDVYSRKIVGSHISTILDANLCLQTLNNVLKNHKNRKF